MIWAVNLIVVYIIGGLISATIISSADDATFGSKIILWPAWLVRGIFRVILGAIIAFREN